jgi:hypothetical protein
VLGLDRESQQAVQFGYGLNYRLGLKPERLAADTAALANSSIGLSVVDSCED